MPQKIWFVLVLLLVITPLFLLNNAEARSADEPCSYLNPSAFKKDAAGNCIRITPVGVNTSEPCSYLKPEKYQRDPNTGLCHKVTPPPTTTTHYTSCSNAKFPKQWRIELLSGSK